MNIVLHSKNQQWTEVEFVGAFEAQEEAAFTTTRTCNPGAQYAMGSEVTDDTGRPMQHWWPQFLWDRVA
jgi:hypothetical protein